MNLMIQAILLAILGLGQTGPCTTSAPCSSASDFAFDLQGNPDPNNWGTSGAQTAKITFRPPKGYAVRILRAYGDYTSWTRDAMPVGATAGVSFGMGNDKFTTPQWADLINENVFLYVKGSISPNARLPFDFNTSAGGLLPPDNILVLTSAVFLNTTNLPIHSEASFTLVYAFEKAK